MNQMSLILHERSDQSDYGKGFDYDCSFTICRAHQLALVRFFSNLDLILMQLVGKPIDGDKSQ